MEKYDFFIEYKEAFAHERYLLAEYFGADVMIVKGVSAKNGAVFAKSGRILTGEDFNLWGGETVFRLKKFDGTAFSEQEEKILAKLPLEITGQQYFLAAAAGGDIPECADAVFGAGSDFVSGDDSGIRGTGSAFIPFDAGWKRRVGRLISLCTAGRLGKSVQRCTLTLTCGDTEIAENAEISRQGVRDARLRAPLFPGGQRDLLYPITLRQILPDPVGGFLLGKTAGFPRLGQTLIPFHWDHLEFLYLYYIPGEAKAQEEIDKKYTNNCITWP